MGVTLLAAAPSAGVSIAQSIAPLVVALIGATALVGAALLTRRSGKEDRAVDADDREKIRQQGEIGYLSDRLDKERTRNDLLDARVEVLEGEVHTCHDERDGDRRAFAARLAALDERIEQQNAVIRRLLPPGDPHAPTTPV